MYEHEQNFFKFFFSVSHKQNQIRILFLITTKNNFKKDHKCIFIHQVYSVLSDYSNIKPTLEFILLKQTKCNLRIRHIDSGAYYFLFVYLFQ